MSLCHLSITKMNVDAPRMSLIHLMHPRAISLDLPPNMVMKAAKKNRPFEEERTFSKSIVDGVVQWTNIHLTNTKKVAAL